MRPLPTLPTNWEPEDLAAFCDALRAIPIDDFRALAEPILATIDAAETVPDKWAARRHLSHEEDLILRIASSRLNFDLSFTDLD